MDLNETLCLSSRFFRVTWCWRETLRHKRLIVYADNDGARHSWIKETADTVFARDVAPGTLTEVENGAHLILRQVPTASNLADGPSRLDFQYAKVSEKQKHLSPGSPPQVLS